MRRLLTLMATVLAVIAAGFAAQEGGASVTGRWNEHGRTLLELTADAQGDVSGLVYI